METWIIRAIIYILRELRKLRGLAAHVAHASEAAIQADMPPDVAEQLNKSELDTIQKESKA